MLALAHIAKAVAKTASFGCYLPLALADPPGLSLIPQLAAKTLAPPVKWASLSALGWTMLILLGLATWRSVRWTRKASGEHFKAAFAGFGVTMVLYTGILCLWVWS